MTIFYGVLAIINIIAILFSVIKESVKATIFNVCLLLLNLSIFVLYLTKIIPEIK